MLLRIPLFCALSAENSIKTGRWFANHTFLLSVIKPVSPRTLESEYS